MNRLPNAAMTSDSFHVAAKLSEAVDAVRRGEVAPAALITTALDR